MKRSYSVPELCRAANKHFCYDIVDGHLYLADKSGTFGLKTNDLSLLEELQKRADIKLELRSPARAIEGILNTKDTEQAWDTGITIPRSAGYCRVVRVPGRNDDHIVLINEAKLAPFKPEIVTGTNRKSPLILICPDCFAIICPVNNTDEKLTARLLALDEALHGSREEKPARAWADQ